LGFFTGAVNHAPKKSLQVFFRALTFTACTLTTLYPESVCPMLLCKVISNKKIARVDDPSHPDSLKSSGLRLEKINECNPGVEDQTNAQFYFYHIPQNPAK
jgi:hypothetical protein